MAKYFSLSLMQVPKAVKAVLSHQAGAELIRLCDQWGRSCLHHAAAAVRHVISLLVDTLIEHSEHSILLQI